MSHFPAKSIAADITAASLFTVLSGLALAATS